MDHIVGCIIHMGTLTVFNALLILIWNYIFDLESNCERIYDLIWRDLKYVKNTEIILKLCSHVTCSG